MVVKGDTNKTDRLSLTNTFSKTTRTPYYRTVISAISVSRLIRDRSLTIELMEFSKNAKKQEVANPNGILKSHKQQRGACKMARVESSYVGFL